MVTGRMGHISVFCSYAREDLALRDRLVEELATLRRDRVIDDWNDSEIRPGSRWDDQIRAALDRARLVLFIVTPDLMASDYVARVELPRSLELERLGQCQVIPIVARETPWGESPLAAFQALPGDARPINGFDDDREAWRAIATGIHDACKRIVDWENPYKRSQVGDWTHVEQTAQSQGQTLTGQGTAELIEKTDTEAVVRLRFVMGPQRQEQVVRVDLTKPLEDRMGDLLGQMGQDIPANAEMWIGPSQYEEDVLFIGGRRYECVRHRREMRLEQQGQKLEGPVSNWRCVDVPLDGIVKGTGDLGVMQQSQVLLDYGHAGDGRSVPDLFAGQPPPQPPGQAAPAALFTPGRWGITVSGFGMAAEYDVMFHPNGVLQGRAMVMGMVSDLNGQWAFDPVGQVLSTHVVTSVMGMPTDESVLHLPVTGNGMELVGQDSNHNHYHLRKLA